MAVDDQRMQFVIRAVSGKERIAVLCREFGISRPTGYLWRRRYLETRSVGDLAEHSRRPQRSPARTVPAKEQRVVAAREETGWGAKKLRVVLRDEEQLVLPVRTIHRILARHQLVRRDVHGAAPQRFARSTPNELWQMDTKGKYRLEDGQCHALCMVDDHSRYAVGVYALPVLTMEQAHPCIVNSFRSHGLPLAMLMDHGALWWATSNGWGLTWLSVRLIEQGIRLVYGRVSHPQTQGKVERLHRTLGEAMGIAACRDIFRPGRERWRNFKAPTTIGVRTKPSTCSDRAKFTRRARAAIRNNRQPGNIRKGAMCGV